MHTAQPEQRVRVVVLTPDAITYAGIAGQLEQCPELTLVQPNIRGEADVLVFAPDGLSHHALASLGKDARDRKPAVLIANDVNESDLLVAVERGVRAVLPRSQATSSRLQQSIMATAARGGLMPPELLGELLRQVKYLQRDVLGPRGLNSAGLNPREIDVLRLMAEGQDTAEIATSLAYSQRTVKNIIYGFTSRLHLRNRPHAVAYAMRAGVI